MLTITGIIGGIFFYLIGYGWIGLLGWVLGGILSDVVLKIGGYQKFKADLAAGTLGEVYHFENHWPMYRPALRGVWREEPTAMGGVLYDLGPHLIDIGVGAVELTAQIGNPVLELGRCRFSTLPCTRLLGNLSCTGMKMTV